MDEQKGVHPNDGLFSHKREWSSDRCCNMEKAWKRYAEWKKPVTKDNYYTIPFTRNAQNGLIHRVWATNDGGSDCYFDGIFGVTKIFWNEIMVMVALACEYPKKHWIVHFKGINFMLCEYLNKHQSFKKS